MAYLLADAKVTIFRRICSAGMKNVISRFARGGQRGELSSYAIVGDYYRPEDEQIAFSLPVFLFFLPDIVAVLFAP